MEFITYEVEGQVGIITINRPKALNALNSAVLDELDATIDGVDLDAVRCLILTGAGEKSFVAGADIAEMSTLTKEEGEAFGKKGNDIFRKIETLPIPTSLASLCVPPNPGVIPRPTSGCPNTALSEQIRISQLMEISHPPPRANPLTAAITGIGSVSILRKISFPFLQEQEKNLL